MLIDEFLHLQKNVEFVFEHCTDVPGLSDCLKHLEGFYNVCKFTEVNFLKTKIRNNRSSMPDCDNPAELLGVESLVEELSSKSINSLNCKKSIVFNLSFNKIVSGEENAHVGSHLVNHLSIDDKIIILQKNLVLSLQESLECLTIDDLVNYLKNNQIDVIHVKFGVAHISIISQFIDPNLMDFKQKLRYKAKEFLNINTIQENILNVVVHYRQGDMTVFSLPDGRLLSAWGNWRIGNKKFDPEFLNDISLAAYKQYNLVDFVIAVENIVRLERANKNRKICVTFISDGFSRGIERIREHQVQLNLDNKIIDYLESYSAVEQLRYTRELNNFAQRKKIDLNVYIGENKEFFLASVTAIVNTDILLVGSGSFSRSMFDCFGVKEKKLILNNLDNDSYLEFAEKFLMQE